MGWQIAVSPVAAAQFRALDGALRDELIEHVDALSEAPAQFLVCASVVRYSGNYVYRYRSGVVPGMIMELYFGGFDDDPKRLQLVYIGQIGANADQGEAD